MKRYITMRCLGGQRMRNPFRTIRAIAEHVTRCHCRPDEHDFWLWQAARRYLHTGIKEERFYRELADMVREGVLRYDSWNGYSRTDYGFRH